MKSSRAVLGSVAAVLLSVACASAETSARSFEGILTDFSAASARHPAAYIESGARAWLAAERLAFAQASRPEGKGMGVEWDAEIQRLRAFYFRQYHREYERLRAGEEIRGGKERLEPALRVEFLRQHKIYAKVLDKIRGLPDSIAQGPGRTRFLGEMALLRGDTAGARAILRVGWERFSLLDDFFFLAGLSADSAGIIPDSLIEEGFRKKPRAPAMWSLAFDQYMRAGDDESLRRAADLSERAVSGMWPYSVDWRIRHARAAIAVGGSAAAEASLLEALRLLDENPRLRQDSQGALAARREIFSLLREAKNE